MTCTDLLICAGTALVGATIVEFAFHPRFWIEVVRNLFA